MTPKEALAALQSDTEKFLKEHLVTIAGSPQPSGTLDYWIHYRDGDATPPERFRIQARTFGAPGIEEKFSAHSVKMLAANAVLKTAADFASVPGYVLNSSTPPIMVTGQLTACTFAVANTPAGPMCTHLQPPTTILPTTEMGIPIGTLARSISGFELNTALINVGKFAGGTKIGVAFGPKFYPGQNVTIVGVYRGAKWTIWAQLTNGTTPMGAVQVL